MASKFLQDELNYENEYSNDETEIPSYQMQTISSRLKMVDREEEGRGRHVIPFTVGSAFVTHNVKLLKQETLQKLKTVFLSYKNETDINSSNINELRLLKNDIDSFRVESQKLKYYASRKKHLLKAVTSRYMHWNTGSGKKNAIRYKDQPAGLRRKEKHSAEGKELADLLKLHHKLETLFKSNKTGTTGHRTRTLQPESVGEERHAHAQNQGDVMTLSRSTSGSRSRQVVDEPVVFTPDVMAHLMEMRKSAAPAPSMYSRKKRRKHVRKYVPSESAAEGIQELNVDSDETQSNRSVGKVKAMAMADVDNVQLQPQRPQSQPLVTSN